MSSKSKIAWVLLLVWGISSLLVACSKTTSIPTPLVSEIKAIPETTVLVGARITLNVDVTGEIKGYRWEATLGALTDADKSTTLYQAPAQPGTDLVKVFVIYGEGAEIQKSLIINVVAPTLTPTPIPTTTSTPTATPIPTETQPPQPTPTPTPASILVADFTSCNNQNNLGGQMATSYSDPNNPELVETYIEVEGRGCVAHLSYTLDAWAGFYLKLKGLDLTNYSALVFDVRSLTGAGIPAEIKIDLSRPGQCSVVIFSGLELTWTTVRLPLANFGSGACKYEQTLTARDQMDELVFVVDLQKTGKSGQFELDNIRFEP